MRKVESKRESFSPQMHCTPPQLRVVEILHPSGGSLLDRICNNDFKVRVDGQAVQAADPAYKRAWGIVNDIEDYKPFIDELRALKKVKEDTLP